MTHYVSLLKNRAIFGETISIVCATNFPFIGEMNRHDTWEETLGETTEGNRVGTYLGYITRGV
jgi:hypothetical protein